MGIFRFMFAALIIFAMVSLAASIFGGAATAGFAALGAVMLLPILFIKGLFFVALLGFLGRAVFGRSGPRPPGWNRRPSAQPSRPSDEERFEEWHRMAHAREEVDSWAPEVE